VTTEVGAWAPYLRLAGRGLGVVKCTWLTGRGRCTESGPELETANKYNNGPVLQKLS